MSMSTQQAYAAMYAFLDSWYQMTKSDDLGVLLGSMSHLADGRPADAAIHADWEKAVRAAMNGEVDLKLDLVTP